VIGRSLLLAAVLAALAPERGFAQLPGESVYERRSNPRAEVRAVAYEEVRMVLEDWSRLIGQGDHRALGKLMMDEVLFGPLGLVADGKRTVGDTLVSWLPRVAGYHLTPLDFDASGNLAYAFGTLRYDRRNPGGISTTIDAEWVMILYLWGRSWKVRSYLERAGPAG